MKSFFFTGLFIISSILLGQNIKTAQLFNPQTNDLTPFIHITESLIFSFDDLDAGYKRYPYKIVRYNRNWDLSDAYTSEFLNGYDENYIRNYRNSFNTRVNYTHYEVKIPNRDFQFKLSGNYGIQLLDPKSKDVLLEKRFAVYEEEVNVGVQVDRINGNQDLNQKVTVQIYSPQFDLTQNPNESELIILKNNNWQELISIKSPTFALPSQFTFNQVDLTFSGGIEYNWFDTKNLDISGLTTQEIIQDDVYATILYPNEYNKNQTYIDMPDVNGNYYIRNSNIPNQIRANSESDYTDVYFALSGYEPTADEEIFVYGAFNDFIPSPESLLSYNQISGLYETHILLKQGYYNYGFGIWNTVTNEIDYHKISGSYWQTENLYNALFYYRPWGRQYDLLIGYGEGASRPSQR